MEQGLMTRFSKKVMEAVLSAIDYCKDGKEAMRLWSVYAYYNVRYCYYKRHNL